MNESQNIELSISRRNRGLIMASGFSGVDHATISLRSLVAHTLSIQAGMMVETAQAEFIHSNIDFLAVVDGPDLIGVCARRELVQALGSRFGFSLNARQPIKSHLMTSPLRVTTATPITEVFKMAAARTDREFYDDVLLVDEIDQYAGMIPMRTLVRLQTEYLLGNILSLEASRQEIAVKNAEMEKDLLMAREVQLALLPVLHAPVTAGDVTLRIAHRFQPAGGVSGDFFDVRSLSGNSVGILVCDVMGHGVRSALVTAMVRAMIEEFKPVAADPGLFLTRLNRDLTSILRQTGNLIFVTAAYIVIDPSVRRLRYAQAGHPTPLRGARSTRAIIPISCPPDSAGPALGLIGDFEFGATEENITAEDRIILYTDGITEAPSPNGEEFGANRLIESLSRQTDQPLDTALAALLAELTTFCGTSSFPDDVCIVALELTATN